MDLYGFTKCVNGEEIELPLPSSERKISFRIKNIIEEKGRSSQINFQFSKRCPLWHRTKSIIIRFSMQSKVHFTFFGGEGKGMEGEEQLKNENLMHELLFRYVAFYFIY